MSKTWMTGAALGLGGLLLTGCAGGTSGPGVAVAVGDQTISAAHVDRTAAHMCEALEEDFRAQSTVVPMSFIRQGVVQLLSLRAQASQIAEQYGVEPGPTYEREVAERSRSVAGLPEDVRESYVEVMTADALATAVVEQVGRAKLEEEGFAEPTAEQVSQAGNDVFATWPDQHGIEIDPQYGLEFSDGALVPTDTSLSVAVSDLAKLGQASEPDPSYAASLPASQRCG